MPLSDIYCIPKVLERLTSGRVLRLHPPHSVFTNVHIPATSLTHLGQSPSLQLKCPSSSVLPRWAVNRMHSTPYSATHVLTYIYMYIYSRQMLRWPGYLCCITQTVSNITHLCWYNNNAYLCPCQLLSEILNNSALSFCVLDNFRQISRCLLKLLKLLTQAFNLGIFLLQELLQLYHVSWEVKRGRFIS